MKKLLLTLLMACLLVAVLLFVGCSDPQETTADETEGVETSEEVTTEETTAEETTATVTQEVTANGIPVSKLNEVSELVGTHNFADEGLALMKLFINKYYDTRGNRVLDANGNQITLWAVGSFLEALGSVYKAFPEDEEIKSVYTGLLDRGLRQYQVRYASTKVNGVTPYYYNASAGNQGDYYYDDDEWIALQFLEAYKNLGDEKYLTRAQEILEFIWLGWGTQSNENIGNGGIPWHCNGEGPCTCSNAPAAYAFALFSTLTDDETLAAEYLNRSVTVYDWTYKYMRNGSIYRDSFNINSNTYNNWSGSYNNGVMIAAGSLLFKLTGENKYLTQTRNTARAAYTTNFTTTADKRVKFENDIENYWMDAWLVKGYIEYYKIDSTNTTGYLDNCCKIAAYAIENKLESGWLRVRIDEAPDATWTDNDRKVTNDHPSTDPTIIGGGISIIMVLAEWAELYGENYQ